MTSTLEQTAPPPPQSIAPSSIPRKPLRDRGARATDPGWARPALAVLLLATTLLYTWDLAASGWANSYYAAAVQAGSQSWAAWLFGALDAGGAITVDKPPAALWLMGLLARVFGFNAWSMLVPQALCGVGAVALLHATVRRWHVAGAGLVAGAALALTPAAALMFRFDNPDALLTLLLVAGGYCVVRAIDAASPQLTAAGRGTTGHAARWMVACGAVIGLAFLTKMLQAFLVVPAFALAYLVAAPTGLGRRVRHLLAAGVALVVSGGWLIALVQLWPAQSRPYIGGSTDNSLLDLVIGYNGLERLSGSTQGGPGGGTGTSGGAFGGATGVFRLFGSEMGVEVSWLLPAAVLALICGSVATARAPRTDRTRASLLLWGGWLLVTAGVFSFMGGVVHPYYTVALAPAVAACVAVGGAAMWQRRAHPAARLGLAAVAAAGALWGYALFARSASWHPEVRYAVLGVGLAAATALALPKIGRRAAGLALAAALVAGLTGPAAYSVATALTPHSGSIPTVGSGVLAATDTGGAGGMGMPGGQPPSGAAPGGPVGNAPQNTVAPGSITGPSGTGVPAGTGMPGGQVGQGASAELATLLASSTTRWAAATTGAQSAASLELASGASVIGIGGFSGHDPAPTLAQFQQWVAQGQVHYVVADGGGRGGPGGGGASSEITTWVAANYPASTVGGVTVYDLTAATG